MGIFELFSLVVLVFVLTGVIGSSADEECRVARCSNRGPDIRFPFWLKDQQPEHCGHPGFQLSCHKGKTMLHFDYAANTSLNQVQLYLSTQLPITFINYTSQQIQLYQSRVDPFSVLLAGNVKMHSTSNSSYSLAPPVPFRFKSKYHYHLFSCDEGVASTKPVKLVSLSGQAFRAYYFPNRPFITNEEVTLCTKIFSFVLPSISYAKYVTTSWSTPNCSRCEARGEYCKLATNSNASDGGRADHSTTCFPTPKQLSTNGGTGSVKPVAGVIPGAIFIVAVLALVLYYTINSHRQKKDEQLKIKMFLDDYKAMKPTRYSYADIKKITKQFSDKLGQGGYGSVYKGQITDELIVAVKLLNCDPKADGEDFINEVSTIGHIHHVNVVRLVGYCADGCNRALVYEFQPNNSLDKLTYSAKNHKNSLLGWEKMQEIALGIAKGIEYLHEGCAQQILHFDIKPHNILLDQNFNPKISDFGLAKLCSKDKSIVSMTMARGTVGYIAPEVFSKNFGKVSAKSDVYSFGMLLLEMVGARNNSAADNDSDMYYPEWIYHRLEEGGEVAIQIEKEEDSNIAKKLTIVGLWCIGWHPVDRPSMKSVIQMLERQECPAMPPNPFSSANSLGRLRAFAHDLGVISESL